MVDLLALAHERGCEAELATLLTADLAAAQRPALVALRARFAPDAAELPEATIHLAPLVDYDHLHGAAMGEAAWTQATQTGGIDAARLSLMLNDLRPRHQTELAGFAERDGARTPDNKGARAQERFTCRSAAYTA